MEATTGHDKREAILAAAWRLIRHYGYGKTTIAEIAEGAGVGKGTVYLYFKSKEEIMLALVDATSQRIQQDLEAIADGEGPATARLRACLLHRVLTLHDLVQRYPHGEEVITSFKPAIARHIEQHLHRQGNLLAELIREGVDAGEMASDDPQGTGELLAELFELLTPPYYRLAARAELERFAGQTVDLLLRGLSRSCGSARGDHDQ
jgi:AcrR family transcriptional regulator